MKENLEEVNSKNEKIYNNLLSLPEEYHGPINKILPKLSELGFTDDFKVLNTQFGYVDWNDPSEEVAPGLITDVRLGHRAIVEVNNDWIAIDVENGNIIDNPTNFQGAHLLISPKHKILVLAYLGY